MVKKSEILQIVKNTNLDVLAISHKVNLILANLEFIKSENEHANLKVNGLGDIVDVQQAMHEDIKENKQLLEQQRNRPEPFNQDYMDAINKKDSTKDKCNELPRIIYRDNKHFAIELTSVISNVRYVIVFKNLISVDYYFKTEDNINAYMVQFKGIDFDGLEKVHTMTISKETFDFLAENVFNK